MSLAVGRVTLADAEHTISEVVDQDDRFGLQFRVHAASLAATLAYVEELRQCEGMMVPVVQSDDARRDVFAVITKVEVKGSTGLLSLAGTGEFEVKLEGRRVGNVGDTEFESILTQVVLTNAHGITTPTDFWAAPLARFGVIPAPVGSFDREHPDGTLRVYTVPNGFERWGCDPADWYGAAVEISVDGVVRQGLDVPDSPLGWSLSNGLLTVDPRSDGGIDVSWYDGTAVRGPFGFKVNSTVRDYDAYSGLQVLRNDPEMCVVRLVQTRNDTNEFGRVTLDLGLRRGSRFVAGRISSDVSSQTWQVHRTPNDAGSAGTGFVQRSSNDSDGNRWVVGTQDAFTALTTEGGVRAQASGVEFPFFVGAVIGGGAAQADDTAAEITDQYHGFVSERVEAVRR